MLEGFMAPNFKFFIKGFSLLSGFYTKRLEGNLKN